jgi:hypothetical protein
MGGLSECLNECPSDASLRDANGRFVPGQSGNPAGKKPGTRNRVTVLREALKDGEDIAAARIVIDKALAGDAVAARFLLDRLTPRPRGRAVELDLPEGARAADVLAASDATVAAMAAGEITPDEALTVTRVLDGKLRALKAVARERHARERQRTLSPAPRAGETSNTRRYLAPNANDRPVAPASSRHASRRTKGSAGGSSFFETAGVRSKPALHSLHPTSAHDADFRARLLHSACILQSPGAIGEISAA